MELGKYISYVMGQVDRKTDSVDFEVRVDHNGRVSDSSGSIVRFTIRVKTVAEMLAEIHYSSHA